MIKRVLAVVFLAFSTCHAPSVLAAGLGTGSSQLTPVTVIEFYNAALDHYFMTADSSEAAALDNGVHPGWTRTGYTFKGYTPLSSSVTISPVCRYYGRPEAGLDSHFYSASTDECYAVAAKFGSSWLLESGNVFKIQTPDRTTGACPSGTSPVYRLFNNRTDANHRYTVTVSEKSAMMARGYISEGYGPDGVAMCASSVAYTAPSSSPTPTPTPSPVAVNIVTTQVIPDTFDFASAVTPSNGAIVSSYTWSFGDGTGANGATATHRFTISGTYPVVLTVIDSKGATGQATKNVTATVNTPTPGPTPPPTPTPSGSVLTMPSATSLVNSQGTWTLSGTTLQLNGVPIDRYGNSNATLVKQLGDTIALKSADGSWWVYFPVPGAGSAWRLLDGDPELEYAAPPPPYVGPSNTPDIWSLEMTDYASLKALAGYDLSYNHPYAYNPEFGVDSYGIKYFRFSNNPSRLNVNDDSGSTMIAWFLPIQPGAPKAIERESINVRWLMWIEDDVAPAFTEVGMKLPGPSAESGFPNDAGELVSWRTLHKLPVGNTFEFSDYRYDYAQSLTGTYPPLPDYGVSLKTNRWYVVEVRAVLNTPGVANGYGAIWINGNKVFETTTQMFRNDPATKLRAFHFNFYHGGHNAPKALMHYRVAKLAMSSSYIGVPAELLAVSTTTTQSTVPLPTWRRGKSKDQFFEIPNTAQMAGPMLAQTSSSAGRTSADINAWNGFASDNSSWYGMATGGHTDGWSNKVFKVDLSADQPQFVQLYAGSPISQVPPIAAMATNGYSYYYDGLPASRHTYYSSHYISKQNRLMLLCSSALYSQNGYTRPTVNGFRLSDMRYDTAATWNPIPNWVISVTSLVPTMAKHPVTEDVYYGNNNGFMKWSATDGTWSVLPVQTDRQWLFHGSVIDVSRNRWVHSAGGSLEIINLSTLAYLSLPVTGDPNYATDAAQPYTALVHDTDNDRYLLFVGDSNASPALPGRVYAINPVTAVATKIADVPAPFNGVSSRATYFPSLGGVAYLPSYDSNILFMPTR